jgi:hypothetical protein
VHQIGNDDAERMRATKCQRARDRIRPVAQFLDLRQHPRARRRADVVVVVEHLRDGRDGHAKLAGDPFHRGGSHQWRKCRYFSGKDDTTREGALPQARRFA